MEKPALLLLISALSFSGIEMCYGNESVPPPSDTATLSAATVSVQTITRQISTHYEQQLYQLPASVAGHYALSMYQISGDKKYREVMYNDLTRIANRLNYFVSEVTTPEQIYIYSQRRLAHFKNQSDPTAQLRYSVTKYTPQYLYVAEELLPLMIRADEYGVKFQKDKQFRRILRHYNFARYTTNTDMIKAWAGELAKQVFWLKALGEKDYSALFVQAFRHTYPDYNDSNLSRQQYENKLYGMTNMLLAASEDYQRPVNEKQFEWIYAYFRKHIDTILLRAKPDILAEIGISFLIAGQDNDPVVEQCRHAIEQKYNSEYGLIPSLSGKIALLQGEHRNALAVVLLNWDKTHLTTETHYASQFEQLPYGLVAK